MTQPKLQRQIRVSIEARIAKYYDPKNEEWEWDDAEKWEKHAMNAVLDLQAAESRISRSEENFRDMLAKLLPYVRASISSDEMEPLKSAMALLSRLSTDTKEPEVKA